MTNGCILQTLLLLCFSTTALSISYKALRLYQSSGSVTCQELLLQLNVRLRPCLEDRINFKLPEKIKHQQQFKKKDAAFLIHEMLQNIFSVFTNDFSSTGWNKTIVENLFGELHKQMDRLETILKEKPEESLAWRNSMAILHLKSYYRRLQRYLKDKEYSSCAWMVVRAEIMRNFPIISKLTDCFQN
ncbi:interferon beta [Nannospalax galili]|uniref:interferon beta n=1 Tax=Nannospalax galili TaxID=1026970 RepID=UPI0004ED5325|nr:interferon beta [Nannospalax galili]